MKKAGDLIVIDEALKEFAGEPAWRGIAWTVPGEEAVPPDVAQRNARNQARFIKSLPARYRSYTFENLTETPGNREALSAGRDLSLGKNLFIHGAAGNGKTHLAVATGQKLSASFTVSFWGVAKLFSTLRSAAGGKADKPNLYQSDVLILDDLGKVKPSEFVYQEFYAVLEERWADEKTTIFTANHRPSECARQLSEDAHAAAAILSRMASGTVVEVKGRDERLNR